jgi:hypothetical protein
MGGKVWTGFIWLRIGTVGWSLWTLKWTFGFHKTQGTSWLAERLLASQVELCSMESTAIEGGLKYAGWFIFLCCLYYCTYSLTYLPQRLGLISPPDLNILLYFGILLDCFFVKWKPNLCKQIHISHVRCGSYEFFLSNAFIPDAVDVLLFIQQYGVEKIYRWDSDRNLTDQVLQHAEVVRFSSLLQFAVNSPETRLKLACNSPATLSESLGLEAQK